MLVYRISKTKYATDRSGEGAKLYGGRWNNKLIPCIYTSESRALALLEYTVNINIDNIPRALSIITLDIPETGIYELNQSQLPGDWKDVPAPSSTKDLGSNLLNEAKHAVIKIPSAIIANEFNYILNPRHPNSKNFKITDIKDFVYDIRIKLK
ncbi:MAG TPA: RES family NAD+ phosphorylase [Parafilimonas sp.]|nr:RES family NAD+ phosphorylase [Parafilimonas sp.]